MQAEEFISQCALSRFTNICSLTGSSQGIGWGLFIWGANWRIHYRSICSLSFYPAEVADLSVCVGLALLCWLLPIKALTKSYRCSGWQRPQIQFQSAWFRVTSDILHIPTWASWKNYVEFSNIRYGLGEKWKFSPDSNFTNTKSYLKRINNRC